MNRMNGAAPKPKRSAYWLTSSTAKSVSLIQFGMTVTFDASVPEVEQPGLYTATLRVAEPGFRLERMTVENGVDYLRVLAPLFAFRCRDTEALFRGRRIARFRNFETVAMRKLAVLNRVVRVEELRIPPNNRLEALKGDRKGRWSIRINDQWRICFKFSDGRALDVEIVDYH